MNRRKRNPLDKPRFLRTVRQKWLVVVFILAGGILWADLKGDIIAADYLSFLTVVSGAFILGSSVDSALKISKTEPKKEGEE